MSIKIEDSWKQLLNSEFNKNYFKELILFVKGEYSSSICYPKGSKIFSAFNNCPISELKVVIIGQDPYHGPNQAHGLAFSVQENVSIPPSLKNIFKEISEDLKTEKRLSGDLSDWANQGVLLLNTCLTVFPGRPGSHSNLGWQEFTDSVIRAVDAKDRIVFILWGSYARKKKELLCNNKNLILEASHPSPLSAHRGFFGCKHFSKTNQFLNKHKIKDIDWTSLE